MKERLDRGGQRQRERGGLCEGQRGWQRCGEVRCERDVVLQPAVEPAAFGEAGDAVADAEAGDGGAGGGDDAGDVVGEDGGECDGCEDGWAELLSADVDGFEGDGVGFDDDLVVGRGGVGRRSDF